MRHMGGCTECFTVWWGCGCPLRCEECGAGYRDDGNSNCGTPGCKAGQRRHWAMIDRWEALREESATEAVPQVESSSVPPPARCRTGVQNGQARRPDARSAARPFSRPDTLVHRPVAERRDAVEALLGEGLSDREIAWRVNVSPLTVSAVRKKHVAG